jgi:L-fuconolactonase
LQFPKMSLAEFGIVDAHCHLWDVRISTWLEPGFGPIYKTFTPMELGRETQKCGVSTCVLIESGTSVAENQALAETADSSELIAAFVPFADLESPQLESQLDSWQVNSKFRGVRVRLEGHPDSEVLDRLQITEGARVIARRGLVLEFLARTQHLRGIRRLSERVPELKAVIEHMAKPDLLSGEDRVLWQQSMKELAQSTPVLCKLSLSPRAEDIGELLANKGDGWPVDSLKPWVQELIENFGPGRLMWGSDWPVTTLTGDYVGTYQAMRTALGSLDAEDELSMYRTTAIHFYGFA